MNPAAQADPWILTEKISESHPKRSIFPSYVVSECQKELLLSESPVQSDRPVIWWGGTGITLTGALHSPCSVHMTHIMLYISNYCTTFRINSDMYYLNITNTTMILEVMWHIILHETVVTHDCQSFQNRHNLFKFNT